MCVIEGSCVTVFYTLRTSLLVQSDASKSGLLKIGELTGKFQLMVQT